MVELTVDTSVSTIGSSAHLGSTLHHNMVNNEVVNVQTFVLSVALGIPKSIGLMLNRETLGSTHSLAVYHRFRSWRYHSTIESQYTSF